MTIEQAALAAQLFEKMRTGYKPNKMERALLRGILDRMDEAERTGAIAMVVRIMLESD